MDIEGFILSTGGSYPDSPQIQPVSSNPVSLRSIYSETLILVQSGKSDFSYTNYIENFFCMDYAELHQETVHTPIRVSKNISIDKFLFIIC